MRAFIFHLAAFLLCLNRAIGADSPPLLELKDGDRVVFLGDTFIEREPAYGYVELNLTARTAGKDVVFRNLGWSADTVLGESRAGFGTPASGFDRLKEQLNVVKPTVVFLSHGMASSFKGEAGLTSFKSDVNKLMDSIQEISPQVRFVLLGPVRHEDLGAPLPDPSKHNEQLRLYTKAIGEIAESRRVPFVSLFDQLPDTGSKPQAPLTDNGIHLNAYGYWLAGEVITRALGIPPTALQVRIHAQGQTQATGLQVGDVAASSGQISFSIHPASLPVAALPAKAPATRQSGIQFQFEGLAAGNYVLKHNGKGIATYSAADWANGKSVDQGPLTDQVEEMRKTIMKKNELWFHRWRPQNETYLFGFRKYEQGQNAREIPMFDPLVSEEEKKIASLKKPQRFDFVLEKAQQPSPVIESKKSLASSRLQPPVKPQPTPEFEIAPGFEVSLYAESPQLAKPIQMNFDPQGRLWIASSEVYPQIAPGQIANDKILILEDTDHDGKADKSTVFADGLLIPTGVEPGNGGAYVGQSTELLFFKDTDGDGQADEKKVVLSGFGTEDTHHIIHTLRWGHDGLLYFNQSIYIHSHMETPNGVVRLNSGGILALRPETLEVGIHMRGLVNGWGHHFDRYGQSFATDGAGGEGINYVVPGAMYVTYAGARRILGSVSPGSYPKFASLEVVESEHFPDDWQGNFVTCDFRAHRVVRFSISERNSAYVTREMPDLLRTTNVTFRPIDIKLGPDGAIYVADWSNPIIQHGEVDFRDPRRDHENGRIWRITAKGRPLLRLPDFARASNQELLDHLLSKNNFNRQRARRMLTERQDQIVSDLAAWTRGKTDELALLEGLWMHQSIRLVNAPLLEKLLAAKDGRIRAAAVRVLSEWHNRVNDPVLLLSKLAADEHPRVRLEAVRALAKIPTARSAELVLSVLDRPMDNFLDYAIWLSINDLATPWIEAVQKGIWKVQGREHQLEFGLKAVEPQLASAALSRLWEQKIIPHDGSGPWIDIIGRAGSAAELKQIFELAVAGNFNPDATIKTLTALTEAARLRNLRPATDLKALLPFLRSADEKIQLPAAQLAGQWKIAEFRPVLLELAGNRSSRPAIMQAAFQSLRSLGGRETVDKLRELTKPEAPSAIRQNAAATLVFLEPQNAASASAAISVLADVKEESELLSLWRALLTTKGAAPTLARVVPRAGYPPAVARTGLRVAREGGRKEPELVLALARHVESEESKALNPAELQQLASSALASGSAERGERIYRRSDLACTTCHAIGGVGGKVGPDMTSLGASAPADYLVESILFPNQKIKEGFHAILLETKDGEEVSGVLLRETPEQLILRDVSNRELSVPKNSVQKKTLAGSLMPSGLVDNLSAQDQSDLYRFLSELGKPGPYDASKGNVARFWRLFAASIDIAQFGDERVLQQKLTEKAWVPAYSYVDGRLPRSEFEARLATGSSRNTSELYAATQFDAPKAGSIRFDLENLDKAPIWIDGKQIASKSPTEVHLQPGRHTVVVKLDAKKLPESIRVRASEGAFLTE